ncbi:hypothetical protein [Streptomyces canus]|uniref:hypothetical protein n=1 Tax=Streptomyces canus TaxID=58343 RepID=UPI003866D493|nr:hypothetical protein OH824_31850 [Streptomyces canus]
MAVVRRSTPAHPLFHPVFEDWCTKADVFSALPNAPVVPDDSRQERSARWRLPARPARRGWGPTRLGWGRTW